MNTLDSINLSNELVWTNKYNWSPVVQSEAWTLSGAYVVETALKLKGQKITLAGSSNTGWMKRSVFNAIKAKADTPNLTMTLTYNGTAYSVMFDHVQGAINASNALPYTSAEGADDWVKVDSLNFVVV